MEPTTPSLSPDAPAPTLAESPRRTFLLGGLIGGAAGLLGGAAGVATAKAPGWSWTPKPEPEVKPEPPLDPVLKDQPEGTKLSYAQFGEDLVAAGLFYSIGVSKPTYLDVGAYEPIRSNNTYLFYRRGARGVLVEPNVAMTEKLKRERPDDKLIIAGVGIDDAASADYYVMSCDELNTFDKTQAERLDRETDQKILRVIKMPLLKLDRVIAENFGGAAPDFLSIDIEGLDYAVLKTLDYARFRPKVICVETLVTATLKHNPDTSKLLVEKGYELRGMTYPNVFFMDKQLLRK